MIESAKKGVKFNDLHSFHDFGLILMSLDTGEPEPKTHYIEIPGRQNPLDITEVMFGRVMYKQRTIKMTFIGQSSLEDFHKNLSRLRNSIHGKSCKITLDTDPYYYYIGRPRVSASKDYRPFEVISVEVLCDPYKYSKTETTDPWEWDPFSFETGTIYSYSNLEIPSQGTLTVKIHGPGIPVHPTVTSTKTIQAAAGDSTYSIPAEIPVKLDEKSGELTVVFTNDGPEKAIVNIRFRGESL